MAKNQQPKKPAKKPTKQGQSLNEPVGKRQHASDVNRQTKQKPNSN